MDTPVKVVKINRIGFYSKVRQSVFNGKLVQSVVDGFETIFSEMESRAMSDNRWIAYILGTTYHESGHTMQPVAEFGKGKGRKYGVPDPISGKIYYGRGFSQITWKSNYEKFSSLLNVDLVHNPDLALDCKIATDILFEGMTKGIFTGKKLSDYFSGIKEDWINARRIINGIDCAELIAGYSKNFYVALL